MNLIHWLEHRTTWQAVAIGLGLAALIEIVTITMRFGFDLQSTRDTVFLARLTFGYRIHHGYFGCLFAAGSLFVSNTGLKNALLILGFGLIISDIVHHFAVLWPMTGDHQFHIRYTDYR